MQRMDTTRVFICGGMGDGAKREILDDSTSWND
jgi:hypothetical protein